MKKFLKLLIVCIGLCIGSHAWAQAQHTHCAYGFQDSSCGATIATGAQSPPTCPASPGWTTIAGARWQGSHFSSPQCNYQAPPSCPAGYSTVSSASWNGSSWVGLACAIPPPPGSGSCQYGFLSGPTWTGSSWSYTCNAPPPPTPTVTCASEALAQGYTLTNGYGRSGPFTGYYINFDGSYGHGAYYNQEYGATGPVWTDTCGTSGNTYILYCPVSPTDGSAMGQLTGNTTSPGSAACGGPN